MPIPQKKDFARAKYRLLVYGPKWTNAYGKGEIASKYGFFFSQVAGCEVTKDFVKGIEEYNDQMCILLEKRNGKDWRIKYEKEMMAAGEGKKSSK